MTQRLSIHPTHPQPRLIERAATALAGGALAILPSDADYLFAWSLDARDAEERVLRLRALDTRHLFTVLCNGLTGVSALAKMDDSAFRLLKSLIPGPYTFILPASSDLPRRLKQNKRRTIGCRVCGHPVTRAILTALDAPLVVSSVVLPEDSPDRNDPDAVAERLLRHVDLMLDAGSCPAGPTSIIDLTGDTPKLLREGTNAPALD